MEIHAHDEGELIRIAWHLGNRHLPVQLLGDRIRIRADHVIGEMVEGLGRPCRPDPARRSIRRPAHMPAAAIVITTTPMTDHAPLNHDGRRCTCWPGWLSPAFPTGAFAYSHGLEWAVEAGDINETQSARMAGRCPRPRRRPLATLSCCATLIARRRSGRPGGDRSSRLSPCRRPGNDGMKRSIRAGRSCLAVAPWTATADCPEDAPYPSLWVPLPGHMWDSRRRRSSRVSAELSRPTSFRPPSASCRWARPPACGSWRH